MANPHHYSKLFLGAFDGHSEDMAQLTIGQRYVWLALLAFARAHEPHGLLNTGIRDDDPIPASLRRLARWAQVSVSTVKEALDLFAQLGMIKQDGRRRVACWEIANWDKWQVHHGLNECSAGEHEGVRQANTGHEKCSAGEHQCSAGEHQCSAGEHQCSAGEQALGDDERSAGEHTPPTDERAQGIGDVQFGGDECSPPEQPPTEVKSLRIEEDDPPTLLAQCEQVLSVLCDGGAKVEQILMACTDVHPRAREVLLQECAALAARHVAGERALLHWLPSNVADAARKLEASGDTAAEAEAALAAYQAQLDAQWAEAEAARAAARAKREAQEAMALD